MDRITAQTVNAQDDSGKTALHRCAQINDVQVAKRLLYCGADISIPDNDGLSPLATALMSDSREVVTLILGSREDAVQVSHCDAIKEWKTGLTVLHLIPELTDCSQYSKLAGVIAQTVDFSGNTPVHLQSSQCFKILRDRSLVNTQNHFGQTPLHLAMMHNNADIVKQLLKHEADINITDKLVEHPATLLGQ